MEIKLHTSVTNEGRTYYHWELRNHETRHFWFMRITEKTFLKLRDRYDLQSYSFRKLPARKESPKAATVYTDVYTF